MHQQFTTCANGFGIASLEATTVWEDISSYTQLNFFIQEIQLDTSQSVVGYIKNDLQSCIDTKSTGLLLVIGICLANLQPMFTKNTLNLFDISCLSDTTLLFSLNDNIYWFLGLFLKKELIQFHFSLDMLFEKIFM